MLAVSERDRGGAGIGQITRCAQTANDPRELDCADL